MTDYFSEDFYEYSTFKEAQEAVNSIQRDQREDGFSVFVQHVPEKNAFVGFIADSECPEVFVRTYRAVDIPKDGVVCKVWGSSQQKSDRIYRESAGSLGDDGNLLCHGVGKQAKKTTWENWEVVVQSEEGSEEDSLIPFYNVDSCLKASLGTVFQRDIGDSTLLVKATDSGLREIPLYEIKKVVDDSEEGYTRIILKGNSQILVNLPYASFKNWLESKEVWFD